MDCGRQCAKAPACNSAFYASRTKWCALQAPGLFASKLKTVSDTTRQSVGVQLGSKTRAPAAKPAVAKPPVVSLAPAVPSPFAGAFICSENLHTPCPAGLLSFRPSCSLNMACCVS